MKLVSEWYTASICILPLIYPNAMITSAKTMQASSDNTSGTVGLLTCVLVAFVLWVVSIDVFLGVVCGAEPTSFVFCAVM